MQPIQVRPDESGTPQDGPAALSDIPDRIGAFRIVRRIGAGGMGVVFEAEQLSPRRRVALKMMHPALTSPESTRRFDLEAQVLARLQHPGIARIFECGACDVGRGMQPYIAMEFIDGCDLGTYARTAGLDVARKLELVARIADAVHHAHERGVIHRDLKPANVLVDRSGAPVVVDFGVARANESSIDISVATQTGQLLGTLAYMAPEQLTGGGQANTRRVDVYALGVILYELLLGRVPHDVSGLGIAAAIALLTSGEVEPLGRARRELKGDVENIVATALERDPARRYASAAHLAADIRAHLAHLPIRARGASARYRAGKLVQRHRKLVTAITATIAALALGFWLRGEVRARATLPRISIIVRGADGAARPDVHGVVALRPIDDLSGEVGDRRVIGTLPLTNERIAPGRYRVVVAFDDGTSAECLREFEPRAAQHEIAVTWRGPHELAARAMVRFEAHTWRNAQPGPTTCPNRDRAVRLDAYFLDRSEVSNAEYRAFLLATKRTPPALWTGVAWTEPGLELERGDGTRAAFDDLPVVGVSALDAEAYAEWAGVRLPTHAEWESAARGAESRDYPWGARAPGAPLRGATRGATCDDYRSLAEGWRVYLANAAPVVSHADAATPEGLLHMLGNVAEFTETLLVPVGATAADRTRRYAMGAAWDAELHRVSLANAHSPHMIGADGATAYTGFRCARSAAP